MQIATIVGARPQFIKAASVSRLLRKPPGVEEFLIHTGQHYDENMSDVFFSELEIPKPDVNLGIGSGTHGAQTGRMIEALEKEFLTRRPDWVLVYGDTNSTLAGALAAVKLQIPIAHVEAGLRSFNRQMPEEINRVLTDHISGLLFAPTEVAVRNLRNEGIQGSSVHQVGDVMYDTALFYSSKAEHSSHIIDQIDVSSKSYILATIHRAENTDDLTRLKTIFDCLKQLSQTMEIVLPLHPRTRGVLAGENMLANLPADFHLIEPVGYLDMIMLEKSARLIVTDSGGVQKEAYFYSIPCVTLRDQTEWVELIESRWNRLCPPSSIENILAVIRDMLNQPAPLRSPLYGNGNAAEQIVNILGGSTDSETRALSAG